MFGFAAGESRTLASFRRCYNSTADETISPSGFYQRLTPTLTEYLCDLVERGLDEVAVPNATSADIDRKYIDVEVEVEFKRGPYNGTQSLDTKRFHVVGVLVADADDYHLYVTNLARKEFFPADLAQIYRCRWEVELLFRELKTQYNLEEFDTSDEHVVKILLYAALLSLLVSRELLDLVTEQADDELVFPTERWAATFRRTPSFSSTNSVSTSATHHRRCLND